MRAQDMDDSQASGRKRILQAESLAYEAEIKSNRQSKKDLDSFFDDEYRRHAAGSSEKLLQDATESNYKSIDKFQSNKLARSSQSDIPELTVGSDFKNGSRSEVDSKVIESGLKVAGMGAALASGSVAGAVIPAVMEAKTLKSDIANVIDTGSGIWSSIGKSIGESKANSYQNNDSSLSKLAPDASIGKSIGELGSGLAKSTMEMSSKVADTLSSAATSSLDYAGKLIAEAVSEKAKAESQAKEPALAQEQSIQKQLESKKSSDTEAPAQAGQNGRAGQLQTNSPAESHAKQDLQGSKSDFGAQTKTETKSQPSTRAELRPESRQEASKQEPKQEKAGTPAGTPSPAMDTKSRADNTGRPELFQKADAAEASKRSAIQNGTSTDFRPSPQAAHMDTRTAQPGFKAELAAAGLKSETQSRLPEASRTEAAAKLPGQNAVNDIKAPANNVAANNRNVESRVPADAAAGKAIVRTESIKENNVALPASSSRAIDMNGRVEPNAVKTTVRSDEPAAQTKILSEAGRNNNSQMLAGQRTESTILNNAGKNTQVQNQNGRAEAASVAGKFQSGLNIAGPRISAEASLAPSGNAGIKATRIESSGNRYLTGVEAGLLIAAVGIAKARSRAQENGQKSNEENRIITKNGKEICLNQKLINEKPGRQLNLAEIAATARRFPGKEITLSTVLALSGSAKIKEIDHSLKAQNKPGEHNLKIERPLDPYKERKTDAVIPALEIFGKGPEDLPSNAPFDNLLGILPAAPVFLRARGRSEFLKEDDIKSEPENESSRKSKPQSSNSRMSHRIKSGESLVSIAESRLNDEKLAWLIADLNKDKLNEHVIDGRRIVEIQAGQNLDLPLPLEIAEFYNKFSRACDPDMIITIVVEARMDRRHIEAYLQAALGLRRSAE